MRFFEQCSIIVVLWFVISTIYGLILLRNANLEEFLAEIILLLIFLKKYVKK